jgi:electron-transferring-flavoprotein dehydrogenase
MAREAMEYDVVIVGGGPAGLSAAIRLKQLAAERNHEVPGFRAREGPVVGACPVRRRRDPIGLNELILDQREGARRSRHRSPISSRLTAIGCSLSLS